MGSDKLKPTDEIIAEVGGLVDETSVCLCVYGEELNPDAVTTRLGCSPTHSHHRGDRRGPTSSPYPQGAWLLEMRAEAPTGPEQVIRRLLMRLPTDPQVWEALAADYDVELSISISFAGWNRGFELSQEVVAKLSNLRARIGFDLYAQGDDEDA